MVPTAHSVQLNRQVQPAPSDQLDQEDQEDQVARPKRHGVPLRARHQQLKLVQLALLVRWVRVLSTSAPRTVRDRSQTC